MINYSKYQKAIFQEIKIGKGNILIRAVAGAGKSFSIIECLKFIPTYKSVGFFAFNNAIVKDLKAKVPQNVYVTTMHSLGWRGMMSYYPGARLNEYKLWEIAKRVFWEMSKKEQYFYITSIEKLINVYRASLANGVEDMLDLANKHNIDIFVDEEGNRDEDMIESTFKVFNLMLDNTSEFDFSDMIFCPAVNDKIILPKFDYVFVDEGQDLTIAQQAIIKRIIKKSGRLIIVGDPRQSVYGFAGSDVESFNKFRLFPEIKELPLSICYRCCKAVVRHAKELVPYIEENPNQIEGIVRDGSYLEIKQGDWVLCRNVKPLIDLCLEMLKNKRKAYVKGDDIGKAIIHLLKRVKTNNNQEAIKKLKEKVEEVKKKLKDYGVSNPDMNSQVISLKEKITVIYSLTREFKSVDKIILKLEEVFSVKNEGIMLSTIHKSKGLENDRVFFLMPELIPSKYAIQTWQLEQETNLKYVAITRAKKELIYINDFIGYSGGYDEIGKE